MKYEFIDHTADIGIRVFGPDLQGLFADAAIAMFDLVSGAKYKEVETRHTVHAAGEDWPDLMVNWLREVLFFWNGKELLVSGVNILSISEYELEAEVQTFSYVSGKHSLKHEIKAVTYYGISVDPVEGGWESVIIFDM